MRLPSALILALLVQTAVHASDAPADAGSNDTLVIQAASMQLVDYSHSLLQALDGATLPANGGPLIITYQGESVPVQAVVILTATGESVHVTPAPYAATPYDDVHLMLSGTAGKPLSIAAVTATTADGTTVSGYATGAGDLSVSYHSTVTQGSFVIAAAELPTITHRATITAAPPAPEAEAGMAAATVAPPVTTTLSFEKPYVPADTSPNQLTISPEAP